MDSLQRTGRCTPLGRIRLGEIKNQFLLAAMKARAMKKALNAAIAGRILLLTGVAPMTSSLLDVMRSGNIIRSQSVELLIVSSATYFSSSNQERLRKEAQQRMQRIRANRQSEPKSPTTKGRIKTKN